MTKIKLPTSVWLADGGVSMWLENPDSREYKEYIRKDSLWQDASGDNLPPIDKEVIVLTSSSKDVDLGEGYAVCFAHRPNPEPMEKIFFDGHTENVYTQTYGKGGWNIPDVVWWLDLDIPEID